MFFRFVHLLLPARRKVCYVNTAREIMVFFPRRYLFLSRSVLFSPCLSFSRQPREGRKFQRSQMGKLPSPLSPSAELFSGEIFVGKIIFSARWLVKYGTLLSPWSLRVDWWQPGKPRCHVCSSVCSNLREIYVFPRKRCRSRCGELKNSNLQCRAVSFL